MDRPFRPKDSPKLFGTSASWLLFAPVGAVAFGLAYWGFQVCTDESCASLSVVQQIEKSLNLLWGRGNYTIGRDPWQLVVAQWLVPGLALAAAAKLFLIGVRRDFRTAFARRSRNHVIVCGLGTTGRAVVEVLREAGERVVAIDIVGDSANAQAVEDLGAPLITGDATSEAALHIAGLRRAKALVLCTGRDAVNLEIALAAVALSTRLGGSQRLAVVPEVRTSWLFERFAGHVGVNLGTDRASIRFLSLHENAARLLYRHPFFDTVAAGVVAPELVLIGFGDMGREVLAQGLRTALALPGLRPRITIFDAKGASAHDEFRLLFPGADAVADLEFREARVVPDDHASWTAVAERLERRPTAAVIVCLPKDEESLFVATRTRETLDAVDALDTAVFVRAANHLLADVLAEAETRGGQPHRFVAYGDLSYLLSASMLVRDDLDVLAEENHETYRRSLAASMATPGPGQHAWGSLPEMFKRSNRLFADHLEVKLRRAGLRSRPMPTPRLLRLEPSERDALAEAEHWRWLVERRMGGWTHGEPRDDRRKRHPALLAWNDLSEPMRDRVRDTIAGVPDILARVGREIRRDRRVRAANSADAERILDGFDPGDDAHLVLSVDPAGLDVSALVARAASMANVTLRCEASPVAQAEAVDPAVLPGVAIPPVPGTSLLLRPLPGRIGPDLSSEKEPQRTGVDRPEVSSPLGLDRGTFRDGHPIRRSS